MPVSAPFALGGVAVAELKAAPWRPAAVAAVATPVLVAVAPWFARDVPGVEFQALRLGALIMAVTAAAAFGDEAVATCATVPTGRAIRWGIRTAAVTTAATAGWLFGTWVSGPLAGIPVLHRLLTELAPLVAAGVAGGMVAARYGDGRHSEAGAALPLGVFVTSMFLPPPWAPVLGPGSDGALTRAALVTTAFTVVSLIACSERAWLRQATKQTRSSI